MKHLLNEIYIPFGSQYYRAPSPHRDDWTKDLAQMSKLGFNMVKFWVQWRWNHPEEERFDFSDIDELMDLARNNNLKVMLNTIFDVAPAWIYQRYPDASMITLDRRKIGPQTQPHRQIGGLGYCFNHPEVKKHFFEFLSTTVKRYKEHPALEIWNVGSEPELTSSMAEMRLYADDVSKMGDMLCFCDYCKKGFRTWLSQKYEKIERLNKAWNRNYQSFDQAEIPITRNTFNDMIDWRMYFVHVLGENVKSRFEVAKNIDQGKHPLMCHHVFIQGFPVTSTANDPWNVGKYGDLHGFTQMDDAMMIDVLRSCAKDKPVISAEMLMLPGYTLNLPDQIDTNDIKRFIFSGVAGNQKGFIFWQYRPEILGREAPTWGLTHLNGSETKRLTAYAESGKVLQNNCQLVLDAVPRKAEIALIYNPENQVFAWMSTKNEKTATDSLLGVHRALYEHNFVIDLIHPMEFEEDILSNYKCIYVPFPYVLNEEICKSLKTWVAAGGVLIGESYFAGWNIENGHHEKNIPGYGLHEVFNVLQMNAISMESGEMAEIITDREFAGLPAKSTVQGMLIKEDLKADKADILARFSDGSPSITISNYGKGRAILIGSYLGLSYKRLADRKTSALIAGLANLAGIEQPIVRGNHLVRADILNSDKGTMLILQNLEKERSTTSIELPGITSGTYVEQFSGEKIRIEKTGGKGVIAFSLTPSEVKVFVSEDGT